MPVRISLLPDAAPAALTDMLPVSPASGATGRITLADVLALISPLLPRDLIVAASDEVTDITTGAAKVTFRLQRPMKLSSVVGTLTVAQSAGSALTFDVLLNGSSIFSVLPAFDNGEETTTTATVPGTLSTVLLPTGSEISVSVTQVGTAGARGLKINLTGTYETT